MVLEKTVSPNWRNNSRKNEEMEPKRKQCPVMDVTGDGSKVRCCKEQYCIGTWNIRFMLLLLLLLSHFSCVRLCATPSLGFSRQEHWSGLPFPVLQCIKVKSESEVAQSCPSLRDPLGCSPLGSAVHGIFQARVLEWGAVAFYDKVHESR